MAKTNKSYAAKGHPAVEDSISSLEGVMKFYHYSPKKLRILRRVATMFEDELVHFGGLKKTQMGCQPTENMGRDV